MESEWQNISLGLISILANINNAMVLIISLISDFSSLFS